MATTLPLRGSLAIVGATAAGACALLTLVPAAFGTGERPHQLSDATPDLTAQTTLTQSPGSALAGSPAPTPSRTPSLAVTRRSADRITTPHSATQHSTTQNSTTQNSATQHSAARAGSGAVPGAQVPQGAPGPVPHQSAANSSARHSADTAHQQATDEDASSKQSKAAMQRAAQSWIKQHAASQGQAGRHAYPSGRHRAPGHSHSHH